MARPIHPFPARMAPELALGHLTRDGEPLLVLDPMAGSGTVLRHAAEMGHQCKGFDSDPLSVLMAKVWTMRFVDAAVVDAARDTVASAKQLDDDVGLPWIDEDPESVAFVDYWFGPSQRAALRKLSAALSRLPAETADAADVLRLALSRIIITKDRGASLARDVSHSRPHKAWDTSDYDVFEGFDRSVRQVRKLLEGAPLPGRTEVQLGDARSLASVDADTVDLVLTSPPYLNALDYMRGHRMSLIWFGHRLKDLRRIRTEAIGTEKGLASVEVEVETIRRAMVNVDELTSRHRGMVTRYAHDVRRMMAEAARVAKPGGRVVVVVGNSCLTGKFIRNSAAVETAGVMEGLALVERTERDLPSQNRYLPISASDGAGLNARMRTESVLYFTA